VPPVTSSPAATPRAAAPVPRPAPAAAPARARIPALDAARALAVVAMVAGHTLDALLALAVRGEPLAVAYWKARGLTAPIFLMASGWAVTVAIRRGGAAGLAIPRGRLPRVLLLLAIAYALRWPGWGADRLASGDRAVWAHLLAFDALHTIAIALLAAALVLALPLGERARAWAFALLAVLAVALGMGGRAPLPVDPLALPAPLLRMALAQAAGGTSPFPLFPWAGHFFVGALVGLLAGGRARALAAVGAVLVAATCWTGVGTMPPGHPVLFAFRTGAVLLLFAALSAVPARAAAALAPLGRASLGVYAIHLPVVYGWSTYDGLATRVGPTLRPLAALGVAAAVLAGSFALHHALKAALRASSPGALALAVRRVRGVDPG
jgi:acyltransferase